MRLLKDGTEPTGPVALQALESDLPEYGTPRARAVTVDLNAMSTLDPALEAMYEASEREAKSSSDATASSDAPAGSGPQPEAEVPATVEAVSAEPVSAEPVSAEKPVDVATESAEEPPGVRNSLYCVER